MNSGRNTDNKFVFGNVLNELKRKQGEQEEQQPENIQPIVQTNPFVTTSVPFNPFGAPVELQPLSQDILQQFQNLSPMQIQPVEIIVEPLQPLSPEMLQQFRALSQSQLQQPQPEIIANTEIQIPQPKKITNKDALKLLKHLELSLREFITTGQAFSEHVYGNNNIPDVGKEIDKRLLKAYESKALTKQQTDTLQVYFQNILDSVTIIHNINDPFPEVTEILNNNDELTYEQLMQCITIIYNRTVNSFYNDDFKSRAIESALLSLEYTNIAKCSIIDSHIQQSLITPMQRLAKLKLFADQISSDLYDLEWIETLDKDILNEIDAAYEQMKELKTRSAKMAEVVNEMLKIIESVATYIPEYRKYNNPPFAIYTREFLTDMVSCVLEYKLDPVNKDKIGMPKPMEEKFSLLIADKLHAYSNWVKSNVVCHSDCLYHDFVETFRDGKIKTQRQDILDALLQDLKTIHQNSYADDTEKVVCMRTKIEKVCNDVKGTLSTRTLSLWAKQSNLADALTNFLNTLPEDLGYYKNTLVDDENDVPKNNNNNNNNNNPNYF